MGSRICCSKRPTEQEVDLGISAPSTAETTKSSYRLVSRLVNEFRDPDDELPKSGYSTDTVFEFLYEEIERGRKRPRHPRRIDNIPPDARNDFLYDLPRAEASENAAIDEACISLIGISNDLKFVDSLEPKVKEHARRARDQVRSVRRERSATFSATTRISPFATVLLSDDVIPAAAFTARSAATFDKGLKILKRRASTHGWMARRRSRRNTRAERRRPSRLTRFSTRSTTILPVSRRSRTSRRRSPSSNPNTTHGRSASTRSTPLSLGPQAALPF